MHPLTITWPPIMYTDYGYNNWKNWLDSGFDNVTFTRNAKVMKLLTRLSIENLLHPFQTFIFGQYNLAPKLAMKYDIPLIFYGETASDYGNPIIGNSQSIRSKSYHSYNKLAEIYLAGLPIQEIQEKYDLELVDIMSFLPITEKELTKKDIKIIALGYYLKWIPQENYYYAVKNVNFSANTERTEGTYQKYASMDDRIDGFFYYTRYIKFGVGRAMIDSAQEIYNGHITKDEGKTLIKKFDGEYPSKYENEFYEYVSLSKDEFIELTEKFRPNHIWGEKSNRWELKIPLDN